MVEIEPLALDALRGEMDRAAEYRRRRLSSRSFGQGIVEPPLLETARDILALRAYPEDVFPVLTGVIHHPYFTKSGRLVSNGGYDPESRWWYEPPAGVTIRPVPENPTQEELNAAVHTLVNDLFADFPFESDTDRTHALAFLLQPFCRQLIQGPTPMALIEAPAAGTGKGLLANCIAIPATGRPLEMTPQRDGDEEWRKGITASLLSSPPFICFDNLNGRLKSTALEAALTTEFWSDRILGESRIVRLPVLSGWIATGNNVDLSPDLFRRVVMIRLDAKTQIPETRDVGKFKHPRLIRWAQENRGELIWAALVIIRAWLSAGRPAGTEMMGSYESWTEVVGGIIKHSGRQGFLANRVVNKCVADDEQYQFVRFIAAWVTNLGVGRRKVEELYPLLEADPDILPDVMAADTELKRRQKLGRYLVRNRGRVVGRYQFTAPPMVDKSLRRWYEVVDISPPPAKEADNAPDTPRGPEETDPASGTASKEASAGEHNFEPAPTDEETYYA